LKKEEEGKKKLDLSLREKKKPGETLIPFLPGKGEGWG